MTTRMFPSSSAVLPIPTHYWCTHIYRRVRKLLVPSHIQTGRLATMRLIILFPFLLHAAVTVSAAPLVSALHSIQLLKFDGAHPAGQ
jgi:hypothetical protein